jgi:hypothetical protein
MEMQRWDEPRNKQPVTEKQPGMTIYTMDSEAVRNESPVLPYCLVVGDEDCSRSTGDLSGLRLPASRAVEMADVVLHVGAGGAVKILKDKLGSRRGHEIRRMGSGPGDIRIENRQLRRIAGSLEDLINPGQLGGRSSVAEKLLHRLESIDARMDRIACALESMAASHEVNEKAMRWASKEAVVPLEEQPP